MLDHANVCWTVDSSRTRSASRPTGSRIVSYLPMAHIAERMTTHYGGIAFAYEVTTCADIRLLGATIAETRPQMLFGVPRTYEKIHSVVQAVLAADPGRAEVFAEALAIGAARRRTPRPRRGAPGRARRRARHASTPSRCVPRASCSGSTTCEVAVTGAAPIPVEVLEFFRALGRPAVGDLRTVGERRPITWEPHLVKPGTVGRPIPGMEVGLAADGEVLGRGGNIFRGLPRRSRAHRRGARRRRLAPHR